MATMVKIGRHDFEEGAAYTYTRKASGEVYRAEVVAGENGAGLVRVTAPDGRQETAKTFTGAGHLFDLTDGFSTWGIPGTRAPKAPAEPKASAPPADSAGEKPKRGRKPKAQAQLVEAEAEPTTEPAESNDPVDLFE